MDKYHQSHMRIRSVVKFAVSLFRTGRARQRKRERKKKREREQEEGRERKKKRERERKDCSYLV